MHMLSHLLLTPLGLSKSLFSGSYKGQLLMQNSHAIRIEIERFGNFPDEFQGILE